MKKTDFSYLSSDKKAMIHGILWTPEQKPRAILQIAHGITEHIGRYQDVAAYFTAKGFVVAGNDHLGHGLSMDPENPLPAYFGPKGSWQYVEEDVKTCTAKLKTQFPGVPICLMGFSLGSFVVRCLLGDAPDLTDMAILAGNGQMKNIELSIAQMVVKREERKYGDTTDTPLLHKLSMESYNRHYAPCRTGSDWLCANPDAVDAYLADPLCGNGFTVSSFRELLSAMKYCSTKDLLSHMNLQVPVLFLSGKEDSVGNFGKGVRAAAQLFSEAHMMDVTVELFDGMRHDIFHEKECEKVMDTACDWMEKRLAGSHSI